MVEFVGERCRKPDGDGLLGSDRTFGIERDQDRARSWVGVPAYAELGDRRVRVQRRPATATSESNRSRSSTRSSILRTSAARSMPASSPKRAPSAAIVADEVHLAQHEVAAKEVVDDQGGDVAVAPRRVGTPRDPGRVVGGTGVRRPARPHRRINLGHRRDHHARACHRKPSETGPPKCWRLLAMSGPDRPDLPDGGSGRALSVCS